MNELVIIGNRKGPDRRGVLTIEYPSVTGLRTCRIPKAAIKRREKIHGDRVALLMQSIDGFDPLTYFNGPLAPDFPTVEYMRIAMAMESGDSIEVEVDEKEIDDEIPVFGDDIPVFEMEIESADPPRNRAFSPVQEEMAWTNSLMAGGRDKKVVEWDFEPVRRPAFVFTQETTDGMAPTAAPVNDRDGKPAAYHLFNPDLADHRRPMGAHLGTFSGSYYAMPYIEGYRHFIDQSVKNGWQHSILAYNEGGRARMDCDVSQAGHTLEETRDRLLKKGHKYLDNGMVKEMCDSLADLYRFGFTIHNSLDGSSAFRIQATAMNMTCTNLQTMGRSKNIISFKHNKALKNADLKTIAARMNDVLVEAQEQLLMVEMMKQVPTTDEMLEQLMTLSEKHGLINRPKVVKDEKGKVTDVNRGYMWRLLGHGWTNPSVDWVNVSKEEQGTLYHVYNILSGALTHRPEYNHTDKKNPMQGPSLNMNTLNERLGKMHQMMVDITDSALLSFTAENGTIDSSNVADIGKHISDHGIPILGKVPLYSEVIFS